MKTVTLELVADTKFLADMCFSYGHNESKSRCPVGYEFGCPFSGKLCEEVTQEMWDGVTEESES